jgi:hypothetical protein
MDVSSEYLEVERRAYHERNKRERKDPVRTFSEQIDQLADKPGWRVTKRRDA